jgi:hypothetical protein
MPKALDIEVEEALQLDVFTNPAHEHLEPSACAEQFYNTHPDLMERLKHPWPSCRSLTYHERHRYAEGFLELEDKNNPIVATIQTMQYFTCILQLPEKPDIPTDFLAVIFGDHFVPETSLPPFTDR